MTEAEWLACDRPGPMLEFLRGRATDRQLRLFAYACCRSVLPFIPPGPCREAVEVALRHADGESTADELAAARAAAIALAERAGPNRAAAWAACEAAAPSAIRAARAAAEEAREQVRRAGERVAEEEARAQAGFLRDIIGNPFRPVAPASVQWLAGVTAVRDAAEEVYAGGPQENLLLLADELERGGCADSGVLDHCRGPGPHVRGCWVIDLLLRTPPQTPEVPPGPAPASPSPVSPPDPTFGTPSPLAAAFADYLGPAKYRRALRRMAGAYLRTGRLDRPPGWEGFVSLYPAWDDPGEGIPAGLAVCGVHGHALVARVLRAPPENPGSTRDPVFLRDRATLFPYAHPAEMDAGPERRVWWCPACQAARDQSEGHRGLPAAGETNC